MNCRILALCLLAFATLFPTLSSQADNGMAIAPEVCLECHDDVVTPVAYGASVHGTNACTSCHTDVTSLDAHMSGDVIPEAPKCVRCHKKETSEHYSSVHKLNEVSCADCHDDIHTHSYWKGDKTKVIAKCTGCHDDHEDYIDSSHGKAVMAGNLDSAACNDCHGLHKIEQLGDPDSHINREFHTKVCLNCHGNKEMMDRNGVFSVAVSTYMSSYHGKNFKLGSPDKVAGCGRTTCSLKTTPLQVLTLPT
jgi:predicted CXXCH cytochrome family protein